MGLRASVAAAPATRDELVLSHVDLVKSMAHRLRRRLPAQVEVSELVSAGVLGLIDAASRYQPALGVPFDAFARRRIQGAMLDTLRSLDHVPRSVRRRQRQAEEIITRLRPALGREPEREEIAAELGISPEQYDQLLDEIRTVEVAAIRTVEDGDVTDCLELAIEPECGPYLQLERRELKRRLADALSALPDRERQILALSYVEELTLAEIGRVFNVGESRVSQLRTQAVMRLRSLLRPWIAVPEAN